jgi:hypothetical protein
MLVKESIAGCVWEVVRAVFLTEEISVTAVRCGTVPNLFAPKPHRIEPLVKVRCGAVRCGVIRCRFRFEGREDSPNLTRTVRAL